MVNGVRNEDIDLLMPITREYPLLLAAELKVPSATPTASIKKLKGNKNELTITVTEKLVGGEINVYTETFTIHNNAAGTYTVGKYKVYVNTKGNGQIRQCYIPGQREHRYHEDLHQCRSSDGGWRQQIFGHLSDLHPRWEPDWHK